jgi:hypothetical protein
MRAARRTQLRLAPPLALAVALAAALPACTGDDDNDEVAAGNAASALESGGELSRLVAPLQASADLGGLTLDAARARKIQNAILAFRGLVTNPLCVKVATDGLTFLDVAFDHCRIGLVLELDGSLHAGVAIELTGALPTELVVTVAIPSLTLTGPLRSRRLAGELELRQAIPPLATPVSFAGDLRFAADGGPELALSLGAEWTVVNGCVTFTGGAQLSGELPGGLGPIALSGERIQSCPEQCPTAGSVQLSYGPGTLLAWTYTGASTVTALGPRGKRVEVALACGGS